MALDTVLEKWGEQLVIVACQEARTEALFGLAVDTHLQISEKHYCVLERIGRARHHGEVCFKIYVFYYTISYIYCGKPDLIISPHLLQCFKIPVIHLTPCDFVSRTW